MEETKCQQIATMQGETLLTREKGIVTILN